MPHHDAGRRTDPPVSVPIAHGAIALATATPEPLLDPPGVRATSVSHGFHGVPMWWLVPQPPIANSTVWVLPSTIMPAAISLRAKVAVVGERRSRQTAPQPVEVFVSRSMRGLSAIVQL